MVLQERQVRMMEYLKKSKHKWMIPVYAVLYMLAFSLMENSKVKIHLIHSFADDKIPFCEYFIIPYALWFLFLAATVLYFTFFCASKKEYYQYIATLGIGMTLFLIISYVYPNGQNLRPALVGDGAFIEAVRFLYRIDTPTNIFPSMHVFNAVASCIALSHNKRFRRYRGLQAANIILTVSIVLSTMFLKQHSVEDVMTALILNIICYQIFYRAIPEKQEQIGKILTKEQILTVPNLLSAARLVLAMLFMGMLERHGLAGHRTFVMAMLLAVVATDVLDGRIAKNFRQTSEVGKILDPLSDKVMQMVILICMIPYYSLAKPVLLLFFIKESYMVIFGWKVFVETDRNQGSRWHGKLNTAVCYAVAVILFAGPQLPHAMDNMLIGASAVCMLMSFVMYIDEFRMVLDTAKPQTRRKAGRVGENWIR